MNSIEDGNFEKEWNELSGGVAEGFDVKFRSGES